MEAAQQLPRLCVVPVEHPEPGVVVSLETVGAVGHECPCLGEGQTGVLDGLFQALQERRQDGGVLPAGEQPGDWTALAQVVDHQHRGEDDVWP